jgi:hypothetical protein
MASVIFSFDFIIQLKNEAKEYHQERLERNENAKTTHQLYSFHHYLSFDSSKPRFIFKDKIHELAHIHNIEIIYSLNGQLLKSSKNLFQLIKCSTNTQIHFKTGALFHRKKVCRHKTIDGKKNRSAF